MEENMIVIIDARTFYFDFEENLNHKMNYTNLFLICHKG